MKIIFIFAAILINVTQMNSQVVSGEYDWNWNDGGTPRGGGGLPHDDDGDGLNSPRCLCCGNYAQFCVCPPSRPKPCKPNHGDGNSGNGNNGGDDPPGTYRTLMTYNIHSRKYGKNGDIIKEAGAHVCAVQEIYRSWRGGWSQLQNRSGMDGEFFWTMHFGVFTYGIGLLYKSSLGTPDITTDRVDSNKSDKDLNRGIIIAEFSDFIFVSTHLPTGNEEGKKKVIDRILNNTVIVNTTKRVFIAGDMNFEYGNWKVPHEAFTKKGYELLNDTTLREWKMDNNHGKEKWVYGENHRTTYPYSEYSYGRMIDLIWGKKENPPVYEVTSNGVPSGTKKKYSDHKPYVIRVKFK